ncbi:PAS domain S-box protein [Methanoculleus sp. FWC-SCC1]|uniref:histidine kinase n=1 Tax=Methanoculleus frigidifontis TaxID=2584085 RepID=A0ABT8M984_9EURY|nr:PAS domain S-box protein [Methanoculleus sp. FWC-SCC1]MDN7024495.1 PAS domain S-box protein [Methanoculleus sp. FWC-SCC1]
MHRRSDPEQDWDTLRRRIIGLGERSIHKSYYPELQSRLAELERFRAILDQTNDAIFLIDAWTGLLVDANESAWVQLGYKRGDLMQTPFCNLIAPEKRIWFLDFFAAGKNPSRRQQAVTAGLLAAGGTEVPVEVTIRFVTFGEEQYAVAVARDITERMRAEEELRIKESALESSTNGILIADVEGYPIYANPAFLQMFAFASVDALSDRPVAEFFDCGRAGANLLERLVATGSLIGEGLGRRSDGLLFNIQISGSIVRNDAGDPLCMMFICMDITERKAAERIQREAYEQLRRNIEQFAILGDHIRNPLQVIVGLAEMIEDPLTATILSQSRRIDGIITELDRGWVESESVRRYLKRREPVAEE